MPLTKEQLLTPRVKVIADYPLSPFVIGSILTAKKGRYDAWYYEINGKELWFDITEYKHIFQPLPWWSDRKIFELPRYVKCIETPDQKIRPGMILKVAWCAENWGTDHIHTVILDTNCYEPATEEEYTA